MKTQRTKARKRGWPVFLALAVAPPVAAGVVAVCLLLLSPPTLGRVFLNFWVGLAVITSAAQWTLGLGWHFLAIRKNWRRANGYLLAGAAIGAAIGVAYAASLEIPRDAPMLALPAFAAGTALAAGLMAGSMWLFWLMRRPDRDIPPEDASVFD